jgi:hypothetical protein
MMTIEEERIPYQGIPHTTAATRILKQQQQLEAAADRKLAASPQLLNMCMHVLMCFFKAAGYQRVASASKLTH